MLLNHLEGHKEITRKNELLQNLKRQLQHDKENIFDYTPISFQVSIPEGKYGSLDFFLQKFLKCYEALEKTKAALKGKRMHVHEFNDI